jgi:acetyltransferase-like isoleucine patch superfamily enzyme
MQRTVLEQGYNLFNKIKYKIFTLCFFPCFFKMGKHCSIVSPFRFNNLHLVQLGNRVSIHQGSWLNVLNEGSNSYPKIIIGNNVSIGMNGFISCAQNIIIDDWVLLGRNVYISDHGHAFKDISRPITIQGIRKIKEIHIGTETWIGNNSVILPGASIGKHCVIGANSIVNSIIPDFSVAAGSPAKIVSRYNTETEEWIKIINE